MSEASRYRIGNVGLTCKHCGGDVFTHRHGQLNTAGMSFLNLDWLNRSADIYVCQNCGFLHWFLDAAHRTEVSDAEVVPLPGETPEADDLSQESQCLACGATIPPRVDDCPKCGWTYRDEPEAL